MQLLISNKADLDLSGISIENIQIVKILILKKKKLCLLQTLAAIGGLVLLSYCSPEICCSSFQPVRPLTFLLQSYAMPVRHDLKLYNLTSIKF